MQVVFCKLRTGKSFGAICGIKKQKARLQQPWLGISVKSMKKGSGETNPVFVPLLLLVTKDLEV